MATDSNGNILPENNTEAQQMAQRQSDPVITTGKMENSDKDMLQIALDSGRGSMSKQVAMSYLGHNYLGVGDPTPLNTDNVGMTFFVRPRLNLSYDNIIADRRLSGMLSDDPYSIPRIVRAYLDPDGAKRDGYTSPVVDPDGAFIPLLSNKLVSLNGWPDPMIDTYTTKKGRMNEEQSQYDGIYDIFSAHDLDANFRNTVNDPIGYMMSVWCLYGSLIKEGWIDPYVQYIIRNEMDYNSRIWRLILDPGRRYVQRIGACGAAIPVADSSAAAFNFDESKPFNRDLDQISTRWRIMGASYRDPRLVLVFNETVVFANPTMADKYRTSLYVKAPPHNIRFSYRGYPRIDPHTMELEWWIRKDVYTALTSQRY